MASLKDIRRRINSVKSTQKITNAMKLVSAAKFARASHAVQSARPYGTSLDHLVQNVLSSTEEELFSPLLRAGPERRVLLVVIATDRGLCGGLNTNLFKRVRAFLAEKDQAGVAVEIAAWGRRASFFARKSDKKVVEHQEKALERPTYAKAVALVEPLLASFKGGTYDRVYIAFARYQSALVQEPSVLQLLPIDASASANSAASKKGFLIEPSLDKLLETLLIKKVFGSLYRILLEGAASEHGSRMTAMDSATKNAKEVIKKLTLQYNRARQAAITKELIEIVSGAEALG
jgi:F-type H+-transporting ATPase subunit gamma